MKIRNYENKLLEINIGACSRMEASTKIPKAGQKIYFKGIFVREGLVDLYSATCFWIKFIYFYVHLSDFYWKNLQTVLKETIIVNFISSICLWKNDKWALYYEYCRLWAVANQTVSLLTPILNQLLLKDPLINCRLRRTPACFWKSWVHHWKILFMSGCQLTHRQTPRPS